MATPSDKNPEIEDFLEQVAGRTTSITNNVCAICRGPATEFRDDVSRKEYTISGLCQKCQDEVFGEGEDE